MESPCQVQRDGEALGKRRGSHGEAVSHPRRRMLPETLISPGYEATSGDSQIWKALADGRGTGGLRGESNLLKFTRQSDQRRIQGSPLSRSPFPSPKEVCKETSESGGMGGGRGQLRDPRRGVRRRQG